MQLTVLFAIFVGSVLVAGSNVKFNGSNLFSKGSLSNSRNSSVQLIYSQFGEPFEVLCDQEYEGGGWIVIQNRYDGSVDFYRGWEDYERGFGDLNGEFWLGLRIIHELTYTRRYELHVLLEDWDGICAIARYSEFFLGGSKEKYKIRGVGKFSGNAGDSFSSHFGLMFSTFDADNDESSVNCAVAAHGAWWYKDCYSSNLNGKYMQGNAVTGMVWWAFRPDYYSLKSTRMMIRAVD